MNLSANLVENDVELAALDWFQQLGYVTAFGPHVAPDEPGAERKTFGEAFLAERLRAALRKLNPTATADALDDAFRRITIPAGPNLTAQNRAFHRMLVDGLAIECRRKDGSI